MDRFIQQIVKEAGVAVLKRFGKDGMYYMKSDNAWDVVTKADLISEKILISRIKGAYPEHGIISEERGSMNVGAEYVWVIDPIDGTLNFSRGVPMFGIMLALIRGGEVILSAIHLPAVNELFFAKAGKGTYRNGKKVHCSLKTTLDQSYGYGSAQMSGRPGKLFRRILATTKREKIRMQFGSFGSMSANVCYAACGGRDWIVPLAGSVWDFAPSYLILKESGCAVTDTMGKSWKFGMTEMVAANPRLHKKLLKLTRGI